MDKGIVINGINNVDNKNNNNVEVSIELIKNFRNLIEVCNSRIKWKTEELLPIGIIIKQLDDLLKNNN
tara:strand:+ start:290 stop:493 length:204 start_codon:yes stop_codon:yes gene_type:complete